MGITQHIKTIGVLSLFFASASIFASLSNINKDNDFQIWNLNSIEFKVYKQWSLRFTTEYRFGDDASTLFYKYFQGQIPFRVNKWLKITPGYRQEYIRTRTPRKWNSLNIPMMDITFIMPTSPWVIFNRNRTEYIMGSHFKNFWLYRNLTSITFPIVIPHIYFSPVIGEEAFFRQYSGFSQNRLSIGLMSKFSKNVQINMFYIYRNLKRLIGWNSQNIVNIQFRLLY